MLAIVVTAYRIPKPIIERFLNQHFWLPVFLVTDAPMDERERLTVVHAPEMEVFSITRCSNLGIMVAIDRGADIVCKTDIDCIITPEAARFMERETRPGNGFAFRYWSVREDSIGRGSATLMPRVMGTCCMASQDWHRAGFYCDAMDGYGYDDYDIQQRAKRAGIDMPKIAEPKIYHIDHEEKHNRATCNPPRRSENAQKAST